MTHTPVIPIEPSRGSTSTGAQLQSPPAPSQVAESLGTSKFADTIWFNTVAHQDDYVCIYGRMNYVMVCIKAKLSVLQDVAKLKSLECCDMKAALEYLCVAAPTLVQVYASTSAKLHMPISVLQGPCVAYLKNGCACASGKVGALAVRVSSKGANAKEHAITICARLLASARDAARPFLEHLVQVLEKRWHEAQLARDFGSGGMKPKITAWLSCIRLCYIKASGTLLFLKGKCGDATIHIKADLSFAVSATLEPFFGYAKVAQAATTGGLSIVSDTMKVAQAKTLALRDSLQKAMPKDRFDAIQSSGVVSATVLGSGVAGAAVLGTGGGAAGFTIGGAVGAAMGVVPAVFTFGLSIPVGAAIGSGAGTVLGAAAGAAAGFAGGSRVGYGVRTRHTEINDRACDIASLPQVPFKDTSGGQDPIEKQLSPPVTPPYQLPPPKHYKIYDADEQSSFCTTDVEQTPLSPMLSEGQSPLSPTPFELKRSGWVQDSNGSWSLRFVPEQGDAQAMEEAAIVDASEPSSPHTPIKPRDLEKSNDMTGEKITNGKKPSFYLVFATGTEDVQNKDGAVDSSAALDSSRTNTSEVFDMQNLDFTLY